MLVRLSLLVRVLVLVRVLRVLMVLVVVLVMVTQELVDTPSGHGAPVCSHKHRSLGKALAVSNHSPFRKCNLCTVIHLYRCCWLHIQNCFVQCLQLLWFT